MLDFSQAPMTSRYERQLQHKFREAERLAALSDAGRELYRRLSLLRRRLAHDSRIPAYQVLSNQVLLGLCERRPTQTSELAAIPGFGQVRLKAYGAEVIAVLRAEDGGEKAPTAGLLKEAPSP